MAESNTKRRTDAIGRSISDEEWDRHEAFVSKLNEESKAHEDAAPKPLGWAPYLKGLGAQAASGATLGFSNYLPGVREAGDALSANSPVAAGLANIAGFLPSLLIAGPERLAVEAGELASGGAGASKVGNILSSLIPNKAADALASKAVSAIPGVSKSTVVVPAALSGALQGGTTAYNNAAAYDPDPVHTAMLGAVSGGGLGATLSGAAKYVLPAAGSGLGSVLGSLFGITSLNKAGALKKVLQSSGTSRKNLLDSLRQLPAGASVYEAAPATLGSSGLLRDVASVYPELREKVRDKATSEIAEIFRDNQGLTQEFSDKTLPGTYDDYLSAADDARRQAVAPLYEAADKIPVDLTAHPELLNHYVVGNEFTNFLNKVRNSAALEPADRDEANRFLANRAQAVSAAENSVRGLDSRQVGRDTYNRIYNDTLASHAADNNLDLSVPRPLISNYIDDLNANRPDYTKQITRLTPNPVNDATRVADMTSRAIQEIHPEYAAAQQMYAKMSIPKNRAALAQTITKRGSPEKLDSQVTADFIKNNRDYAQRAIDAKLNDDIKPLTRYVLDEKILNASNGDPALIPSAILKTIGPNVRPRAEEIFGPDEVNKVLNKARRNDEAFKNRVDLANSNLGSVKPDHSWLEAVFIHNPVAHVVREIYSKTVKSGQNKEIVDFLHADPKAGIASIEAYLKRHPEGDWHGYAKYINSLAGNFGGNSAVRGVYDPSGE